MLEDESKEMELIIVKEREQTTEQIRFDGITVKDLLKAQKINSETVIVVRNNEILLEEDTLNDNDIIEILSVVSGG